MADYWQYLVVYAVVGFAAWNVVARFRELAGGMKASGSACGSCPSSSCGDETTEAATVSVDDLLSATPPRRASAA